MPGVQLRAALLCAVVAVAGVFIGCRKAAPPARSAAAASEDKAISEETVWITANKLRLKTKVYKPATLIGAPVLIVVLHGDSPFGPPSYQYIFARRLATQLDNAVVVALLRPGYTDDVGDHSTGDRGLTTGDNYTSEVVDAVASAVNQLKLQFHPACTALIGHSGGAAISADLLGRWPSAVNAALLVSCPCDLETWREHMGELQSDPLWLRPVRSISPMEVVDKVSPAVRVRLLVGSADKVAPASLTETYAKALREHGDNVTVTVAPGLPHDILLEPITFEQAGAMVGDCGPKP